MSSRCLQSVCAGIGCYFSLRKSDEWAGWKKSTVTVPVIFKPEVKSPPSATLIWTPAPSAVDCNPLSSCEYDLLHFRSAIFPHTLNFILCLLSSQYENPWLWISTHRRPGSGWGSNAASQYSKRSLLVAVLCTCRVTDELVGFFVNPADQIQEHSAYCYY